MLRQQNVAYLVLAHADVPHLRRLLAALPAESIKLVHLDKKFGVAPELTDVPNTVVLTDRTAVYWADFSIVEATLSLLRAALRLRQVERIVLLSGSCYPIASDEEILDFFRSHSADNFIKAFSIEDASALYHDKLRRVHVGEGSIARFAGHHPTLNLAASRGLNLLLSWRRRDWRRHLGPKKPYFGSQWWSVTRACGDHILERVDECRGLRLFESTFAPDEMYFHTIVANSLFGRDNIVPFEGRGNWRLANLHLINNGSLRYVFGLSDLERVVGSNKLFVRKVSSTQSGPLLDALDARRGRPVQAVSSNHIRPELAGDVVAHAGVASR